jgi:hypothetical protein
VPLSRNDSARHLLALGRKPVAGYGIAAVIAGRFLPLLRSALPILAGANRMAFWPFLFATIVGGIAWVTCVAFAAFYFGVALVHLSATAMIFVGSGVATLMVFTTIYIRRHEAELLIKAEQEIPGPLPKSSFRRTVPRDLPTATRINSPKLTPTKCPLSRVKRTLLGQSECPLMTQSGYNVSKEGPEFV